MLEILAGLGWVEIVAAGISILTAIGVIMNRAFIKPLKDDIDDIKQTTENHEGRLRAVEQTQAEHGVEISTVKEVAMKLVERMDRILDRFTKDD